MTVYHDTIETIVGFTFGVLIYMAVFATDVFSECICQIFEKRSLDETSIQKSHDDFINKQRKAAAALY